MATAKNDPEVEAMRTAGGALDGLEREADGRYWVFARFDGN
jgi:sugar lactone lactonase YvrE